MSSINQEQDVRPSLVNDAHQRYVYIDFTKELPFARATSTPFGNPTGTAGNVNTLVCKNHFLQYHVIGTQTILGPKRTDAGLDITQDDDDNDGIEYTTGCEDPADTVISDTQGSSQGTFKVGTDGPFAVAMKVTLADVSELDEMMLGLRKAEAYQAVIEDDYDEMAAFDVQSGDIFTRTILNGGTTTATDTTDNWADAATKTIAVICDSDGSLSNDGTVGKCYFVIDGEPPTTEASSRFKFDSGELVQPFFAYRHDGSASHDITVIEFESGLFPLPKLLEQYDIGDA